MNSGEIFLRQNEIEKITNAFKQLDERLQEAYRRGFEAGYREGAMVGYFEAGPGYDEYLQELE